jgi:hypothetical protein
MSARRQAVSRPGVRSSSNVPDRDLARDHEGWLLSKLLQDRCGISSTTCHHHGPLASCLQLETNVALLHHLSRELSTLVDTNPHVLNQGIRARWQISSIPYSPEPPELRAQHTVEVVSRVVPPAQGGRAGVSPSRKRLSRTGRCRGDGGYVGAVGEARRARCPNRTVCFRTTSAHQDRFNTGDGLVPTQRLLQAEGEGSDARRAWATRRGARSGAPLLQSEGHRSDCGQARC